MPLPLLTMQPSRTIATSSTSGLAFTLFKQGEVYALYNDRAGTGMMLDISAVAGSVSFTVKWFDPRNGGALQNGSVTTITGGAKRDLGSAPNNTNMDWAVLVTKDGGTPTNIAPVVNAGADQSVTLPTSASLVGSATDDGLPSGSTFTTTWSKVSGPGVVTFVNASATSTSATFSLAGTYVLRLTASDGTLSTQDDKSVIVSAAPINVAPTVNAGPDKSVTLPAPVSLVGSATDDGLPSTSTLSTTWSKLSGPGVVTFANASAKSTTATFSVDGTYVLRLTASDGTLSATDDVSVTVTAAGGGTSAPLQPAAPTPAGDGTATPSVSGVTTPGATVHIFVDGVEVGTTTAGSVDGKWNYTITGLPAGTHIITVTSENAGGTSPPSTATTVTVAATGGSSPPASGGGGGGRCGLGGLSASLFMALFAALKFALRLRSPALVHP